MEYYVGLDVSLNRTSIWVVNQTGSVAREGVVDSNPAAIAAFVRSNAPGAVRTLSPSRCVAPSFRPRPHRLTVPARNRSCAGQCKQQGTTYWYWRRGGAEHGPTYIEGRPRL
jgi:hypothetical protein